MARMAAHDGTRVLLATPHSPGNAASRRYDPALIVAQVATLNQRLRDAGVPLTVITGTEVAYQAGMVEQLRQRALLTLGESRTVLFEPPYAPLPPMFDTAIFSLQLAGYRVLFAHPERVPEVQSDPAWLIPLVERGVMMQITADALLGGQGERLRRTAETLLTHRLGHVLASDAHGLPPRRAPLLSAARARAAALVGAEAAEALVHATPDALLHDRPLTLPPPEHPRRWGMG